MEQSHRCIYCGSHNTEFVDFIDDIEDTKDSIICIGVFLCRNCDEYFEDYYEKPKKVDDET